MKLILSRIFYHLGDVVSRTIMRWGDDHILLPYGYPVYNKLMIWSANLDTKSKIWKKVKSPKRK